MTRQAIIDRWHSLTPAERDVWVRRAVFPEIGDYPSDHEQKDRCPACGYDGLWGEKSWGDAQPYTQHPTAARLVVERMRERGFVYALGSAGNGTHWARFATVEEWERRADGDVMEANEETAAAAIGLAALLALDRVEGSVGGGHRKDD